MLVCLGALGGAWVTGHGAGVRLSQVVGHDLVELPLCDITELQVLDLDSFTGVTNMIDLRLHLIKVALEAFFRFLIGKFDFF